MREVARSVDNQLGTNFGPLFPVLRVKEKAVTSSTGKVVELTARPKAWRVFHPDPPVRPLEAECSTVVICRKITCVAFKAE